MFHPGVFLTFMEKGSGCPQLFRNLSLCKLSLSPLKSPPAAHVHIKTVDRIPPGNFFHQHSFHGDSEVVLRHSSYTLRWQSWTSINFKELHRVLHLQTKASPKKKVSIVTQIVQNTADNKKVWFAGGITSCHESMDISNI